MADADATATVANIKDMDKEIRKELTELVGAAITAATRAQNERYVTAERLCDMFQMFTKSRLKTWGSTLPRIRATFVSIDGEMEQTGWAYNVAAIQKMIDRNDLVFVEKEGECVYRPSKTSRRSAKHIRR